MDANLVLMRHGETTFTAKNIFAGRKDVPLSELGVEQCRRLAGSFCESGLVFDTAFTSMLRRTKESCQVTLDAMGIRVVPTPLHALNEREYGALTGMNREDARRLWGARQVADWRRSFDIPPPNGESLKDLAARTWPCLNHHILPAVLRGGRVLVVGHGNVLRTLMTMLERLPSDGMACISVPTASAFAYRVESDLDVSKIELAFPKLVSADAAN